ncbi:unnamed protein product [Zymoseptoria tritici ST99CH_1A5]|uniref:Uncharacterized protein n=2 Tax=Zymoseptoria tritici TaxID=1047171 RepID=A0A1X7RWV2_ZYMT9|nr:unnamed protein product [Zymoseptoria tritici ST99CH_3D7]SMR56372.1 unnamed protein product [Zymoseptoria tritici ST99CH_3D1]SMY25557.1 unnamed protein product [Zymoseptoria tritici ST99CH_1A5]
MSPIRRPALNIALPNTIVAYPYHDSNMPKTPEALHRGEQSEIELPPPPRAAPFKVKRKRPSAIYQPASMLLDNGAIPTIEMSEVPTQMSSPTFPPASADYLSPVHTSGSFSRALTPPKTPEPKLYQSFSQMDSPADEWDMINQNRPAFQRAESICSSFSDSSISSCGSSAFSAPTTGYDSPQSEANDPFVEDFSKHERRLQSPMRQDAAPKNKRVKTRRDVKWTHQMDDHLWMTFSAYLSDPTLTPFKMLPGSTPPMGVCDQVATKAKRTWRHRKTGPQAPASIDAVLDVDTRMHQAGSPDTIRPTALQASQNRWPRAAATRRRLRELCTRRPSISAHYQRMLRTRSPSPFETSDPATQQSGQASSLSGSDMVLSLVTSTAPSMQPDGPLAQLAKDDSTPEAVPTLRQSRPEGWFDRIPRSKAHQKSASLQSELRITLDPPADVAPTCSLASPFDVEASSSRSHLLQSMANTKSLGRTEFNGRSLDSPVEFRTGALTDRRSRKRRFRSDEEKPRRGALEDVFGPPVGTITGRSRGFTVGATQASDNLANLFAPRLPLPAFDMEMTEAPSCSGIDETPFGARSAPRRLAEPVPRLGSPFMETPPPSRQHNTFPRSTLLPTTMNHEPFHQRLVELVAEHQSTKGQQQQQR